MSEIKFGFIGDDNMLAVVAFGPDNEGLPWYESTDERVSLDGLAHMATISRSTGGFCVDTAEWISPAATEFMGMLSEAQPEVTHAVGHRSCWSGTKTWGEDYTVDFYK